MFFGLLHFVRNDALLRVSANQQKSVIARNEAIQKLLCLVIADIQFF